MRTVGRESRVSRGWTLFPNPRNLGLNRCTASRRNDGSPRPHPNIGAFPVNGEDVRIFWQGQGPARNAGLQKRKSSRKTRNEPQRKKPFCKGFLRDPREGFPLYYFSISCSTSSVSSSTSSVSTSVSSGSISVTSGSITSTVGSMYPVSTTVTPPISPGSTQPTNPTGR